jgi:hypothetical protein
LLSEKARGFAVWQNPVIAVSQPSTLSNAGFYQAAASLLGVLLLTGVIAEVRSGRDRHSNDAVAKWDRAGLFLFSVLSTFIVVGELAALTVLLRQKASGALQSLVGVSLLVGLLGVPGLTFFDVLRRSLSEATRRLVSRAALVTLATGTAAALGFLVQAALSGQAGVGNSTPPAPVARRARRPTQTSAPGIQFTDGKLNVGINGHVFNITAGDWNTITDKSVVQKSIGIRLDPDFHAVTTTKNRFQYLADHLMRYAKPRFAPVGIASGREGKALITVVALINPRPHASFLTGLHVKIRDSPSPKLVAAGTFFVPVRNSIVLRGNEIYFVRLHVPLVGRHRRSALSRTYSFHWDSLVACAAAVVCSR